MLFRSQPNVQTVPAGGSVSAADNNVFDERMYVGRIQFNLNDGKKRRFLYFQADYEPKYQTNTGGEGDGPFTGMAE